MNVAKSRRKGEKRYSQVEAVLRLALQMQRSYTGVSLNDIQKQFDVSRRTAERMRDAVFRAFGRGKETIDEENRKRWRIPTPTFSLLPAFGIDDFLAMEGALAALRADGREVDAENLLAAADKVRGLVKPEAYKHLDVDLEALTEAEGLACRPRPRIKVNEKILSTLRRAMLACKKVRIRYYARTRRGDGEKVVIPLGFLYGTRHYLCACTERDKNPHYYTLSNIKEAEILKQDFQKSSFSLGQYACRSFGVYQEEKLFEIEWKFSPAAAADASEFVFHPTQKMRKLANGSLLVSFKACGLLEMCFHLFTWGREVEILKPPELKRLYKERVKEAAERF